MKGIAKIELFDAATGEKDYELAKEENLVTNAYEKILNTVQKIGPYHPCIGGMSSMIEGLKGTDLLGGLALWPNPIPEDPNIHITGQVPLGYAGGQYVGTHEKRGSLNAAESGPINDGSTMIGYKWVWDFPTNAANGTISALSLVPKSFGDGMFLPVTMNSYQLSGTESNFPLHYDNIPIRYTYVGNGIPNAYALENQPGVIDGEGNVYYGIPNGYRRKSVGPIKLNLIIAKNMESVDFVIPGYDNFSQIRRIKNDYKMIARNTTTGKYMLLTIEKDTVNILNAEELVGITAKISDFGIAGDYLLHTPSFWPAESITLMDGNKTNLYPLKLKVYNLLTKVAEADIKAGISRYGGFNIFALNTLPADGDDTIVVTSFVDNNRSKRPVSIVTSELQSYGYMPSTVSDSTDPNTYHYASAIDNLTIGYSSEFTMASTLTTEFKCMSILAQTLMTINNLSVPVEKTNTKTMKITYILNW